MGPHHVCSGYFITGLPAVVSRAENHAGNGLWISNSRLRKGAHLTFRQEHASVDPRKTHPPHAGVFFAKSATIDACNRCLPSPSCS